MGSTPHDLSFDSRLNYVPETINEFLGELSAIGDVSERLSKLDDFVKRLEEEMRKIDAFKRELPLCMLLINDAIRTLKEESMQCRRRNLQPVLEEFIPLKKTSDEDVTIELKKDSKDKKTWLSSAQLWKTDDCKNVDLNYSNRRQNSVVQVEKGAEEEFNSLTGDPCTSAKNKNGLNAFMPFRASSVLPVTRTRKEDKGELPAAELSLVMPGMKDCKEGSGSKTNAVSASSSAAPSGQPNLPTAPQQPTSQKQRRCWSPELHRRFVSALQELGGSHVATPKQIRELMQVDGLTNDEVKSHLQKYRLHTRRAPAAAATSENRSIAILGALFMPQDQSRESSKQSSSQSASPQGPFDLAAATGGGTSTTGTNSMDEEEGEKSESYGWKNQVYRSGKVNV